MATVGSSSESLESGTWILRGRSSWGTVQLVQKPTSVEAAHLHSGAATDLVGAVLIPATIVAGTKPQVKRTAEYPDQHKPPLSDATDDPAGASKGIAGASMATCGIWSGGGGQRCASTRSASRTIP